MSHLVITLSHCTASHPPSLRHFIHSRAPLCSVHPCSLSHCFLSPGLWKLHTQQSTSLFSSSMLSQPLLPVTGPVEASYTAEHLSVLFINALSATASCHRACGSCIHSRAPLCSVHPCPLSHCSCLQACGSFIHSRAPLCSVLPCSLSHCFLSPGLSKLHTQQSTSLFCSSLPSQPLLPVTGPVEASYRAEHLSVLFILALSATVSVTRPVEASYTAEHLSVLFFLALSATASCHWACGSFIHSRAPLCSVHPCPLSHCFLSPGLWKLHTQQSTSLFCSSLLSQPLLPVTGPVEASYTAEHFSVLFILALSATASCHRACGSFIHSRAPLCSVLPCSLSHCFLSLGLWKLHTQQSTSLFCSSLPSQPLLPVTGPVEASYTAEHLSVLSILALSATASCHQACGSFIHSRAPLCSVHPCPLSHCFLSPGLWKLHTQQSTSLFCSSLPSQPLLPVTRPVEASYTAEHLSVLSILALSATASCHRACGSFIHSRAPLCSVHPCPLSHCFLSPGLWKLHTQQSSSLFCSSLPSQPLLPVTGPVEATYTAEHLSVMFFLALSATASCHRACGSFIHTPSTRVPSAPAPMLLSSWYPSHMRSQCRALYGIFQGCSEDESSSCTQLPLLPDSQ